MSNSTRSKNHIKRYFAPRPDSGPAIDFQILEKSAARHKLNGRDTVELPDMAESSRSLLVELDRIRRSCLLGLLSGRIVPEGYPIAQDAR